ncbi:uncharacterized protein PADG_03827 [Paracoccidioides brasiliensis Pb18]|uniref:Uncharacterized protein n=2 Tax=Paracoccidioides brasiliensis TaxID=121759 RepID=C1G991_PARBD|nr:uncharacterized protein PADG_03827 [Paracoccidioides brasiliensis Pb18]EEH47743.1 hypothetical protein PADG_03827 [Paracoccidioides brasiliensis Pb18]ODH39435.1 hypothetical protein ACO22_01892 [Paracoccidioides brasiliensis]ODH47435.1 hypothetical protein GX48_06471 [Paracoccidioides brasiliensis]
MAVTRGATGNARPRVIEPIPTSPAIKKRRNTSSNTAAKQKAGNETKPKATSTSSGAKRGPKPKASASAGVTKRAAMPTTAKPKAAGGAAKPGRRPKDPTATTKKGVKATKKENALNAAVESAVGSGNDAAIAPTTAPAPAAAEVMAN